MASDDLTGGGHFKSRLDTLSKLRSEKGSAYRVYTAALGRLMDARLLMEQCAAQVEVAHVEYVKLLQQLYAVEQEATHRGKPELDVIQ